MEHLGWVYGGLVGYKALLEVAACGPTVKMGECKLCG